MITIGVDAHERVHVAVAVDEASRGWGDREIANDSGPWRELSRVSMLTAGALAGILGPSTGFVQKERLALDYSGRP